jgi:DNA-binding ferritin-like protein
MTEFLAIARLKNLQLFILIERNGKKVLSDHEAVVVQLRKDIKTSEENADLGTADFLTNVTGT